MKKITKIVQTLLVTYCMTIIGVSISAADTPSSLDDWSIALIGATESNLTRTGYEEGTNYQRSSEKFASLVDVQGKVWDGMPLWQLAGRVDDTNGTGQSADENIEFNDKLAQKGYRISVTGTDGKEATLKSTDIARNNNYILADAVNGNRLTEKDPAFPLVLVGRDIPPDQYIGGVSKITLYINK